MPLREDVLAPIPGDNPGGTDLRYDPLYDKIKENRREEDSLNQGAWQHERKVADWPLVIKLCQDGIATKSKDLQLAAWLTEALLKVNGFGGFREGISLCYGLIDQFWDNLFPELEDGDAELRAAPLIWISSKLELTYGAVPLVRDGFNLYHLKETRTVGPEDAAKTDVQKKARDKLIKEGKLTPEAFNKAFVDTPKAFYAQAERDLDATLKLFADLDKICEEKFQDAAPSFGKMKGLVEEVRHTVHGFLQKKRETEPDPVEEVALVPTEETGSGDGTEESANGLPPLPSGGGSLTFTMSASAEPADRQQAINSIAAAAAFLRRREPFSPAPYLMLRGLRFGELRAAAELSDPAVLEAPPTEVRRHIKGLALQGKWKDLLEAAENVMALPCSRGWLDLQRFVVDACVALGPDYETIAIAIRSELRILLRDLPQLLNATLMDDTPVANADTQKWLQELLNEPNQGAPKTENVRMAPVFSDERGEAGWQKKFIDSYSLALEAQRSGQEQKAFEIMLREIERQRSGRGRFQRRLQLVQLCLNTGKDAIAQPILEDLTAALDTHKLEEWEDRAMVAQALLTIARASKKIQGDAKEKQKFFDRICRLDPVQALTF